MKLDHHQESLEQQIHKQRMQRTRDSSGLSSSNFSIRTFNSAGNIITNSQECRCINDGSRSSTPHQRWTCKLENEKKRMKRNYHQVRVLEPRNSQTKFPTNETIQELRACSRNDRAWWVKKRRKRTQQLKEIIIDQHIPLATRTHLTHDARHKIHIKQKQEQYLT